MLRGSMRTLSKASSAAREARYSTGCLRDIKGGVRALSEALSAARETSATAAWAATADAKGGVRG